MWELQSPPRAKLIIAILAADQRCLDEARKQIIERFGPIDIESDVWPFIWTKYYRQQTGENILRQLVSIERTVSPGRLAKIKLKSNRIEKELAQSLGSEVERPVNLDPGLVEPSKLVLASTKNFSHRIYIGKKIWAEVTLIYHKTKWQAFPYTYPDYQEKCYQEFLDKVREKLRSAPVEQADDEE